MEERWGEEGKEGWKEEEEEREDMSIGKLGVMELHGNELCRTAEHGGASLIPDSRG